jgi:hypothetical protein
MKKQNSNHKRLALLLPVLFIQAAQSAAACGETNCSTAFLKAAAGTAAWAAILLGTPMLAFGFIHLLSGHTREGAVRICTFIGAMGVVVIAFFLGELH